LIYRLDIRFIVCVCLHTGNNSSWAAEEGKNGEVAVNEVEMNEESCLDITVSLKILSLYIDIFFSFIILVKGLNTTSQKRF